jgi:hypothetical protein
MPIIESRPAINIRAPTPGAAPSARLLAGPTVRLEVGLLTSGFRPRGASIVAASTGPVIRTVQRSKTQAQSLQTASISVEATKFLTYVRLVNATINDPINYAINAYTLRNLIQGTSAATTAIFTGATPIITAPSP